MNTLGSSCSTRDIPGVTPSDTVTVGHVRMRVHCKNCKLDRGYIPVLVVSSSVGPVFNGNHKHGQLALSVALPDDR